MCIRPLWLMLFVLAAAPVLRGQSTQPAPPFPAIAAPATQPGRQSAEEMLSQMLRPTSQSARPLKPVADGGGGVINHATGAGAVVPGAPQMNLLPEGSLLVDRIGRITRTDDGQWELRLESDGRALKDPPLLILPSRILTRMQNASIGTNADLRFRVSGEITEYNNRNYILIQKAAQVPDLTQPLRR